jgi:hypothetical protein
LLRSIPVAIACAGIGYLFAQALLIFERMPPNAKPDPANQAVLWRAPLNMAIFGVALLVIFEFVVFFIRRKKPPLEKEENGRG